MHFYVACNELIHMEHLNQKCFSPQNLSRSYHRLNIHANGLVVIYSSLIIVSLDWKVQFQQFKHFYIACNKLIYMEHFNQNCFPLKICRNRIIE